MKILILLSTLLGFTASYAHAELNGPVYYENTVSKLPVEARTLLNSLYTGHEGERYRCNSNAKYVVAGEQCSTAGSCRITILAYHEHDQTVFDGKNPETGERYRNRSADIIFKNGVWTNSSYSCEAIPSW